MDWSIFLVYLLYCKFVHEYLMFLSILNVLFKICGSVIDMYCFITCDFGPVKHQVLLFTFVSHFFFFFASTVYIGQ